MGNDWPTVQRIRVEFPEWPHDAFVAVLLPSGTGEVYREYSGVPVGAIASGWDAWTAAGGEHRYGDEAIKAVVRAAIDAGRLMLTEADTVARAEIARRERLDAGDAAA